MAINITPDYNLFIQILFVFWIFKGIISLICGLVQADRLQRDKYGTLEIIDGILIIILVLWVLFR